MKNARNVKLLLGAFLALLVAFGWASLGFAQRGRGGGAGAGPVGDEQAQIDAMYNAVDPRKGPVDLGITDPALNGAIDIHAHLEPTVPRSAQEGGLDIDFFEYAHLAKLRGLRGYVQKSHSDTSSAGNAYIVRAHVEPSLEVFARFPMNFSTGGINVATVAHFIAIKGGWGRVIEMPTWDAEYRNVPPRAPKTEERPWMALLPPSYPKYVSIAKGDQLLPEVSYLIDTLPKMRTADSGGRLSMATGHSSGGEDILVAREARKVGLQVTSPHGLDDMTPAQMDEYTKLGGFIEIRNNAGLSSKVDKTAKLIQQYGAGSFIVSSDCGFMNYPLHTDCMGLIARALRLHGVSEKDLDTMFKDNPAKFLSLPALRPMGPPAR